MFNGVWSWYRLFAQDCPPVCLSVRLFTYAKYGTYIQGRAPSRCKGGKQAGAQVNI